MAKITQRKPKFEPVCIELQTREEVLTLQAVLNESTVKTKGGKEIMLVNTICDELSAILK